MVNKLVAVSSIVLSISALDAMKQPTWGGPSKIFNSRFSQIFPSQAIDNQSEIMIMLQGMQSSIEKLNQNIQKLSQRVTRLEEREGIFEYNDEDELEFTEIQRLSKAFRNAIAIENREEVETYKNALTTRVKAYINRKFSTFRSVEFIDKKVAVQVLRATEQLGYAYVRTTTNIVGQYFEESCDLLLEDQPISYRITDEVDKTFGFQICNHKMQKL